MPQETIVRKTFALTQMPHPLTSWLFILHEGHIGFTLSIDHSGFPFGVESK